MAHFPHTISPALLSFYANIKHYFWNFSDSTDSFTDESVPRIEPHELRSERRLLCDCATEGTNHC